jgi:hypothetical protein
LLDLLQMVATQALLVPQAVQEALVAVQAAQQVLTVERTVKTVAEVVVVLEAVFSYRLGHQPWKGLANSKAVCSTVEAVVATLELEAKMAAATEVALVVRTLAAQGASVALAY